MEWSATIESVKTGRTDIMLGNMGWTPTRAQVMCITDAIYYAGTFVTMKKDQPFATDVGIDDMKGRSIGTVTGFTIVPEMKKVPGTTEVKLYDTTDACIRDVSAGRLDFAILDAPSVDYMILQNAGLGLKQIPIRPDASFPQLTSKQHTVMGMNMANPGPVRCRQCRREVAVVRPRRTPSCSPNTASATPTTQYRRPTTLGSASTVTRAATWPVRARIRPRISRRHLPEPRRTGARSRMIERADAVVIGSGALGASVAFHLARGGCAAVALLDRHEIASQTSPRAAGLTAQVRRSELMTDLAVKGVREIERFVEVTGEPFVYHQSGSLKIARRAEHGEQLKEEVELGQRARHRHRFRLAGEGGGADAFPPPRRYPLGELHPGRSLSGASSRSRWAMRGRPSGSARRSCRTRPSTTSSSRAAASAASVTERGEILTPVVVDAAGGWARAVAARAAARRADGDDAHQLLITQPIAGVAPAQPITRIVDANVYVRPADGG